MIRICTCVTLLITTFALTGCTQEQQNKISRDIQNYTGTNGLLEIYAGDKVVRRFLKVDKITAMGTDDWTWPADMSAALRALPAGHDFAVPENLFRKITDEERAEWQQKFAGVRT